MANNLIDILVTLALLCVAVAAIIGIVILCVRVYRRYRENKIRKESSRLAVLREINAKYDFRPVEPIEQTRELDEKRKFDRFDPEGYLLNSMQEERERFERWFADSKYNRRLFAKYKESLKDIPASSYKRDSWRRAEAELLDKEKLDPWIMPPAIVTWSYESPAGRNYYIDEMEFDHAEVKKLMLKSDELAERKNSRQAQIKRERALMTDSLRYDVLKRDNYTCQICGSTAQDGVKLEVDHIVPVSKGGKTEMNNLRTLCDRCNRGKRDKL